MFEFVFRRDHQDQPRVLGFFVPVTSPTCAPSRCPCLPPSCCLRNECTGFALHGHWRRAAGCGPVLGGLGGFEEAERRVYTDLLLDVDLYDLWGRVAIPKKHRPEDVPAFYRIAARRRGVFVNPALTEPFGLTLIEAAASGLPVVAPEDGGPRDILENCRNGLLVDPLDPSGIDAALRSALSDSERWRTWARNGLRGVRHHYS